jgi:hypothetical protein
VVRLILGLQGVNDEICGVEFSCPIFYSCMESEPCAEGGTGMFSSVTNHLTSWTAAAQSCGVFG